MGTKDIKDLRGLSAQELDDKLASLKQQLMEYRFQAAGGRLDKPSHIKNARRNIARILTIKKEATAKKG